MTSYVVLNTKENKVVRYKTPQNKEVCVTRELYLRDSVPCCLSACSNNECHSAERKVIPIVENRLLILDADIALNYWEIFECEVIKGLVLTYSTLCYIQQTSSGKRHYNRIKKIIEDPVKMVALFDNEFCAACYQPPRFNENLRDFTSRLNWNSCLWYSKHLPKLEVILITDNPGAILQDKQEHDVITLMSVSAFLETYHQDEPALQQLYSSLHSSLSMSKKDPAEESRTKEGHLYPEHLPEPSLMAGLRARQFVKGVLRVSKFRSNQEATVLISDKSSIKHMIDSKDAASLSTKSEISIRGTQFRNRAVDGDTVVVKLLPVAQWSSVNSNLTDDETGATELALPALPTEAEPMINDSTACGTVVGILNRNWRDYACSFVEEEKYMKSSNKWILVTPWDRRIPRIRICTSDSKVLSKERFLVRIDRWDSDSNYPTGHYVRTLGPLGDLDTETHTILHEYNLGVRPFTQTILDELNSLSEVRPWKSDPAECLKRRDLRSPSDPGVPTGRGEDFLIFSIDPPSCEDVDDALSVRMLPNGRIQLGVHIADVTHFVKPGSFVDLEARRRTTSVYMADRRFDMLPGILSGDICSLWSGRDRYAVSVIWELDASTCEVIDIWYGRTVIRSRYKMAYENAEKIHNHFQQCTAPKKLVDFLGGPSAIHEMMPELKNSSHEDLCKAVKEAAEAISLLVQVATQIRTRRLKKGGLELDSIEVSVRFEDQKNRTGKLEDLIPSEHLEMHSTVAELMIFANHWVARRCLERFPGRSCLRRHPAPKPEHFDELRMCAASRGFNIDADTNQSLACSLNSAVDPNDGEVNSILRQLATRAMTNALYFSTGSDALTQEDFVHYGLALNLYTHFTSPIRRYADVIVHRLLMASISDECAADELFSSADLEKVCEVMNSLHWSAQQAQRCSIELFQAMYFRQMKPEDPGRFLDAIICQLRGNNGFTVQVSRFGIRGTISIKKSDGSVAWITDSGKDHSNKVSWKAVTEGYQVERVKPSSGENLYGFLQVSKPGSHEKQIYKLFDHVKVYVEVKESSAHGVTLKLTLAGLSDPPVSSAKPASQEGKKLDDSLIKTVRDEDSSRQKKRRMETNMDVDQGENEYQDEQVEQGKLIASSLHDSRSSFWKIRRLIQSSQQ